MMKRPTQKPKPAPKPIGKNDIQKCHGTPKKK